jgi:hypothetical protein
MLRDLWIPTGATYNGVVPVGHDTGNGGVVSHELMVEAKDKFGKVHKQLIRVLANGDTSQAEVEDMMGHATENFVKEVREKYDKRPATRDERKQAGKALNEFLRHRTKRRESTTGKLYF